MSRASAESGHTPTKFGIDGVMRNLRTGSSSTPSVVWLSLLTRRMSPVEIDSTLGAVPKYFYDALLFCALGLAFAKFCFTRSFTIFVIKA